MTAQQLTALYDQIEAKAEASFHPNERLDFAHEVIKAVQFYVQSLPSPRQDELDYLNQSEQAAEHGDYTTNAFPGLVGDVRAALDDTNPRERSQFLWDVVTRLWKRETDHGLSTDAVTRLGELRDVVGTILA
jgi:hypothetical protein